MAKPSGYWTKERCIEEAKKYKTRKEFRQKNSGVYHKCNIYRYSDEAFSHMYRIGSKYERLIYAFEFDDKSVYVGLSYNSDRRKLAHLSDIKSQVYKHIQKIGLFPEFKELTEYINVDLASKKEGEILHKYKNDGWKILNKIKTGGLGGDIIKWNKENCILEAKKYLTKTKFQKNSNGAYDAAWKNGWLNDICNHMIPQIKFRNFWNFDRCFKDAQNHQTKLDWRNNSGSAYVIAKRNGWLEICCKHMIKTTNNFWRNKKNKS